MFTANRRDDWKWSWADFLGGRQGCCRELLPLGQRTFGRPFSIRKGSSLVALSSSSLCLRRKRRRISCEPTSWPIQLSHRWQWKRLSVEWLDSNVWFLSKRTVCMFNLDFASRNRLLSTTGCSVKRHEFPELSRNNPATQLALLLSLIHI